jgi:DMSO reductase anchor subunit
MEGLAMALFFVTLIGIIASIVLMIYSAIKKDFKYRPKKLAIVLGIFIVAFIGSTIFYGAVQSP